MSEIDFSEVLIHHGVKGMKWGVRKDRNVILTKKFKSGETLEVTKDPAPAIQKLISKLSKSYKKEMSNLNNFTLRDKNGKKVGEASFIKDSPTSLNLMWIGVRSKHRGKGYATAVLEGVVNYAKQEKLEKLTLEVPGKSDDALHIYKKLGFKTTEVVSDNDDFWGGLTKMEKKL